MNKPTFAQITKACSFKSVNELSDLSGIPVRTLRRWFTDSSPKLREAMLTACDVRRERQRAKIIKTLEDL